MRVKDCINKFATYIDYLEKKNSKDLGDMTPDGKIRNAGKNNYTLYAQWYREYTRENYQAQPYCAMAVSVVLAQTYGLEVAKQLLCGELYYNCESFYQRAMRKHPERLVHVPAEGDIALFYNGSRHHHTGLVERVLQDGYVTIEANTSSGNNTVVPNGGATVRKLYKLDKHKVVFYRPPYATYGIDTSDLSAQLQTYAISTGQQGLRVMANLRVRALPDTDSAITGGLQDGDLIYPDQKAFDDRGVRWYHIPDGWVSGKYLTGWIYERGNGRWWYLTEGDKWYTDCIVSIDGKCYAFDGAGYMITEPVEVRPDEYGVLRL
ncbi:MAG: SH3 domain-containing protein [Eubacteriales bacterium]|nr:SH3 domain-containing protein [Eubacteriales bacterium]